MGGIRRTAEAGSTPLWRDAAGARAAAETRSHTHRDLEQGVRPRAGRVRGPQVADYHRDLGQPGRLRTETHGHERADHHFIHSKRHGSTAAPRETTGRRLYQELQDQRWALEGEGEGADRELDSPLHRSEQD